MTDEREIGIGLLGAGWMGSVHAAAYRSVREHYPELGARPRLVLVADPVESRAREAAQRYGFERWTTDPADVIADPNVEAASLTTPNNMHVELATALAQRGIHFWGEKPLGRFPDETRQIAAAVRDSPVRTLVGYNYRHAPAVVHARELIASGALGDVRSYRGVFLVDYAAHPQRALSWRFSREISGFGVLGDLMSHVVDMAQSLAGPIASVTAEKTVEIPLRPIVTDPGASQFKIAEGELGPVENDDFVAALARFESGAHASFEVSRVNVGHPVHMAFEVRGTKGALSWDFESMGELQLYFSAEEDPGFRRVFAGAAHGEFGRFQPDPGNPMSYNDLKVIESKLFLESIVLGRDATPSVREAVATADVLDAMARSDETGSWEQVQRTANKAKAADTLTAAEHA